jgi:hypothetical protein
VEAGAVVSGREFSDELLERLNAGVRGDPDVSRSELSRRVCGWLDWKGPDGEPKQVSCRVALLKLHRRGLIELPKPRDEVPGTREVTRGDEGCPDQIGCSLAELGGLKVVLVTRFERELNEEWKRLMAHHYLGPGPLVGAQMRYLIGSQRGWVGALAFSAAAWHVAARDEWIGWSERARKANLRYVVSNSRFLIPPWVTVPGLASKVLSLCVRRLRQDWLERYGHEPVLLETFVDKERFRGTCYQAANWKHLGATRGRGRQDREMTCSKSVKDVYALPLSKRWRAVLREEPPDVPQPRVKAPIDWAEEELGGAEFGDQRLSKRLVELARDFYARPQASIPQACNSRARTKAAYRWLSHPMINIQAVLAPHYEATTRRISQQSVVLAVQDTTSFNYTAHVATEGLGPIGSTLHGLQGPQGIMMHDTMAFTVDGLPLGLVDVHAWARDPKERGKKHTRYKRPIEQKESAKWLHSFQAASAVQAACRNTKVVSVGDREADIYELFALALAQPKGAQLLVRAEQDRLVKDGHGRLWAHMNQQPLAGERAVDVPRTNQSKARKARLGIRFAAVRLSPPRRKSKLEPIDLWAVFASEVDAPNDVLPLEWMLLTTIEVTSPEDAFEKLDWYAKRWGIEVFHKTVKSGCRIEERQLATEPRLENCLGIDLVVAWRILLLTMLGRHDPDQPCTAFFEEHEWKAAIAFTRGPDNVPETTPSLREVTRIVAGLGGFLGRKGDGEPGIKSLWMGLQRLDTVSAAWLAFGPESPARAPPPTPVSRDPGYG